MPSRTLTLASLRAARAKNYRLHPHLRVRTEAQALKFLNDVGLSLLFSAKEIELPSLWGALCGADLPLSEHHDHPEMGLAWDWKDSLPLAGNILYGKFLRHTPVFVALDIAPCFYALSPNYGDPAGDYLQEYADGQLSVEAKQVYEALLAQGSLPTSRLRQEAGLGGGTNAGRFDRALAELQMGWRITRVAISDANRWGYCYVYDLFHRHFPAIVDAAGQISGRQAREAILLSYLGTVMATTPQRLSSLFAWQPGDVQRLVGRLAEEGRLRAGVKIEGLPGEHLVLAE